MFTRYVLARHHSEEPSALYIYVRQTLLFMPKDLSERRRATSTWHCKANTFLHFIRFKSCCFQTEIIQVVLYTIKFASNWYKISFFYIHFVHVAKFAFSDAPYNNFRLLASPG